METEIEIRPKPGPQTAFLESQADICFIGGAAGGVKSFSLLLEPVYHVSNPGPGGWAAVLEYGERKRELSGGVPTTTNNRMELQAAIEALGALKEPCEVEFYTDSEYVKNGVQGWLFNWKRNGWRTKSKKPVRNEDLWRALDVATSKHKIKWHWLKGHAGHPGNERCDALAVAEIEKMRKAFTREQLNELLREFSAKADGVNGQLLTLRQ